MPYRIHPCRAVEQETRRILRSETDKAVSDLDQQNEALLEGIHEARKRFKKCRAVLRLVRQEIPAWYGYLNTLFRDIGRELAGFRQTGALLECADTLRKVFPEEETLLRELRGFLEERKNRYALDTGEMERAAGRARHCLTSEKGNLDSLEIRRSGFEALAPGLIRIYRQGQSRRKTAETEGTATAYHEWRKSVKYHWYHLQLLEPLWPEMMKGHAKGTKVLSDLLGEEHDLADLHRLLAAQPADSSSFTFTEMLENLIRKRQTDLRSRAHLSGARVYAEKKSSLSTRFHAYWRIAEKT
ncbi:MAG: CHAD domain-containing protein [Synergistales bacterium]|nr:CHAD domain-containing protein [Synergistales bacterium]